MGLPAPIGSAVEGLARRTPPSVSYTHLDVYKRQVTPLSHKIAIPLAEGLKNPVVCRDDRITRLVPQKLLNVREAIHAALSQVTARQVETNWSMAGPMPGDPDWSGGTVFRDTREVAIDVPAGAVFRAVCRLGGQRGWHGANWLWIIRGWLDRLAGCLLYTSPDQ